MSLLCDAKATFAHRDLAAYFVAIEPVFSYTILATLRITARRFDEKSNCDIQSEPETPRNSV